MAELIVALDTPDLGKALELVERLHPYTNWFKVGLELFSASGPRAVEAVQAKNGIVFLDLKYMDIPNTVQSAVHVAAGLGVKMLTVHLSGGQRMIHAAREGIRSGTPSRAAPPILVGVTMLTSLNQQDISWMGREAAAEGPSPGELALDLAERGYQWGADGVVCSAREAAQIKSINGTGCICVTPGIRMPLGAQDLVPQDDQSRTLTPGEAVRAGADFLVVGRPITRAVDPAHAAMTFLHAMAEKNERRHP
ncbi:MAG: orotidine-5'-phosphate decarboxylase [Desulfovibrionales bacterium]|nr:MAG: orotidine-5'-phosphate decarboxylase [Desulfovibrionales bacterium]